VVDDLQKFLTWAGGLPFAAKLIVSIILVLVVVGALVVLWTPATTAQTGGSDWPKARTLDALTRYLRSLSATDRDLLRRIRAAGDDGVYFSNLADATNLSRYEVQQRMDALATKNLVDVRNLTDKNYRIHDDIWTALGPQHELLERLLK
jgi:hypothetical protein